MDVHKLGDQGLQYFPEFVGNLKTAGGGIGLVRWISPFRPGRLGLSRFGHRPSLIVTLA
jgi:hypothetical protein